jgi:hypothetical protein
MNINAAFPSEYVRAIDLAGQHPVVILSVAIEEIGQQKDQKPVVRFAHYHDGMDLSGPHLLRPAEKRLILNKTNAEVIVQRYGVETDAWPGALLMLSSHSVRNPAGGTTTGVKVQALEKPEAPRATEAELAALRVNAEPAELPGAVDDGVPF